MKGLYTGKDAITVFPAGKYDATVEATDNTKRDGGPLTDKNGNPMQRVTFKLYSGGRTQLVNDWYIVPTTMWKYKKLATALGVPKEVFDAGQFDAADHIGDGLIIEVEVESSEQFGENNKVKGFEAKPVSMPAQPATPQRVQAPRPEIPRQQTAPKPRAAEHPLATAREMDPNDVPFSHGDHLFN